MSDQLNEPATQSLDEKMTARFDRLESLVVSLANQVSALSSQVSTLQTTVNEVAQNQRDMYVDLREREGRLADQIELLRREVRQFIQDQQPSSIASRLLG